VQLIKNVSLRKNAFLRDPKTETVGRSNQKVEVESLDVQAKYTGFLFMRFLGKPRTRWGDRKVVTEEDR
jgi:hypothetical protein